MDNARTIKGLRVIKDMFEEYASRDVTFTAHIGGTNGFNVDFIEILSNAIKELELVKQSSEASE